LTCFDFNGNTQSHRYCCNDANAGIVGLAANLLTTAKQKFERLKKLTEVILHFIYKPPLTPKSHSVHFVIWPVKKATRKPKST
jgi:hypothetical protein